MPTIRGKRDLRLRQQHNEKQHESSPVAYNQAATAILYRCRRSGEAPIAWRRLARFRRLCSPREAGRQVMWVAIWPIGSAGRSRLFK